MKKIVMAMCVCALMASVAQGAYDWYAATVSVAGVSSGTVVLKLTDPKDTGTGADKAWAGGGTYRYVAYTVSTSDVDINRVYAAALTCVSSGNKCWVYTDTTGGAGVVAPVARFYALGQ